MAKPTIDSVVAAIGDSCNFSSERTHIRAVARREIQKLLDSNNEQLTFEVKENREGPSGPSETSKAAAYDNKPRSGSQRYKVLKAIQGTVTGLTRDEIAETLDLPDSSADGRVWELLQGGFIQETDRKRTTRNGSQAVVLVTTVKGDVIS